jgi:hypothetical protein
MIAKFRNYFRRQQASLEHLTELGQECTSRLGALESLQGEEARKLEGLAVAVGDVSRSQEAATLTSDRLEAVLESIEQAAQRQARSASESVWAHVFNSTITTSDWLHDKTFSPGRWAVGYPYLYVLYRVLNEIRPQGILELGLGQSTRMIAQYAEAHDDTRHVVVEHDQTWIDFFSRSYRLPGSTEILPLEWGYVPYGDAEAVRVYSGFKQALDSQRFSLISIDGPLGGDMPEYARIDVLGLMPDCLEASFVIMLDDCERDGESHTMAAMQNSLSDAGIEFRSCIYSGDKDLGLLCSTDLAFLCSL